MSKRRSFVDDAAAVVAVVSAADKALLFAVVADEHVGCEKACEVDGKPSSSQQKNACAKLPAETFIAVEGGFNQVVESQIKQENLFLDYFV